MKEKLLKDIEVEKEILSTLPKNNKKNVTKYLDNISKELQKYKSLEDKVLKEIKERKEAISNKLPAETKTNNNEELDKIIKEYHWFSIYNTSYEKMGFDEILYNLSKEKVTYESINKTIYKLIEKYKEAGVNLKLNDFTYSPIFFKYMKIFYENINDLDSKVLSDSFEKLYWQESNIINHIELTFKSLYYKYQSYFDKYCDLKKQTVLKTFNDNIVKQYQAIKKDSDIKSINITNIYNKFVNKELNPNDFTKEKIEQVMNNYIDTSLINDNNYKDIINEFIKLKHTLEEYSSILKFNYIIEDIKKLYEEKDKYKGIVKTKTSDIKKAEQKLIDFSKKEYLLNKEKQAKLGFFYKLTKRMWYLKNKNYKEEIIDKLNLDIDNQIIEIKKLYDEYEMDKFNEKLLYFNGNSELISLLKLANSYYIYQDKLLENEEKSAKEVIKELNEFILSPYNNLINNINIDNNKDIKQVINNKYELSSINIDSSKLEGTSSIESIISDINKIIYFDEISKSNLSVEEILYVYNIDSIINQ